MKIRYFIFTFFLISIFMHLTWEWFIPYCETTSSYWYLSKKRKIRTDAKILVLGDSQIVSGITPDFFAEVEDVSSEEVLYFPKPSQQPEGILVESLELVHQLPKLRKVYVNLSPLNTSKNSVTDANRQLFYSFGNLSKESIIHPLVRKAYFSNLTDLSWKIIISVFPYFGLSSNLNRLVYDPAAQADVPRRKQEFLYIQESMEKRQGSWVWKSIGEDPILQEEEEFPENSSFVLSGKRDLSVTIWYDIVKLWTEKNVEVVFLRIPFSPKMEKDILKTNANTVSDEIFKTITYEPNQQKVVVFDFRSVFLNDYQNFADLTHLNQKGRDAFSLILKKVLFDHTHTPTKGM
ncbi:hypothetical protein EHQ68_06650 [Leptospira congkakensis]|uniref:DUF1574 domain-containing protein n=1 Tax=Leptospira congkakensis TaxID=2484932 RepID=A0A4Z1A8S9_9LEPT|nr:hypothetical protein [Leptospira congkakensis]TGL87706.1 hypothetical protein EHQ69_16510 [Leptospira congkakensis]TGL89678.1 hypothetical protein EHQ68_06650 [Leptospira congkakensis]TGL95856.1 hypothetical protein EHQ70_12180 [Leptospira congkakensis]